MSGKNNIIIIAFAVLLLLLSYINYFTDYTANREAMFAKIIQALIIVLCAYLLDVFVERMLNDRVKDTRDRYTFRKASSVFITLLAAALLLIVFLKETTTLIIAYGIFSAGVVITLQDVFRNFAGGIIILIFKPFRAGDRMQLNDCYGDVLDITYFHTTLMEIRGWVDGDQYSGRVLNVPNSFILSSTIMNYTKDFSFIWDEVTIILAPGSDWTKAKIIALATINEIITDYIENSKIELAKMEGKYMLTSYDVDTKAFMQIEGDRIEMHLRYVVDPRKRRHVNDMIVRNLLDTFEHEEDISIGSVSSVEITKMPGIDTGSYPNT
ncbi:MAG: mechanosensitive ion channel [Methanolobus sp.]|nr:mechanosensitive ion channel [Methanolobus sp.]